MKEEIRYEGGQNLNVGRSSVTLQTEFETEAATSGISLFVLLTAINHNLAIKMPYWWLPSKSVYDLENDEIHRIIFLPHVL